MPKNKLMRDFTFGKKLSRDLIELIIGDLIQNYHGNKNTMEVSRGAFTAVAEKFKVSVSTVTGHWKRYCCGNPEISRPVRGRPRKVTHQDIDYIQYRKTLKPSLTSANLHSELLQVSTTNIAPRTVRRAVQSYLPEPWTYKKIKPVAMERLTVDNLVYTETYMDLLNRVDPYRLQFMDESGFRLPEVGRSLYGHAPVGQRAIEIVRYHSIPNATLHLLAGLQGAGHYKVTDGPSDSYTFVDFITECVHTVTEYGVPALKPGDVLVVDNAAIHHSQISQVLTMWLEQQGIDVVFTPRYSPDMNPVEGCFSQIKSVLKNPCYGSILHNNLHAAIYAAAKTFSSSDLHAYFRHTGFLNC